MKKPAPVTPTEDDVLRRMLQSPPKKHEKQTAPPKKPK